MSIVSPKPPRGLKDRSEKQAQPRKGMRKVSAKKAAYRRSEQGQEDLAYMAAVKSLPCVICDAFGMIQLSPTQAHHPIHGRFATRKAPDRTCIPLCEGHHQGLRDTTKIALHQHPSKWKRLYGEDNEYIAVTQDRVAESD